MSIAPTAPQIEEFPNALDQRRPEREQPPDSERFRGAIDHYKKAFAKYILEGHKQAFTKKNEVAKRWKRFRQRRSGRMGEQLGKNRIYRPMVTKLIGTMKANIVPELLSNPYINDWLEIETHAPGMKPYIRDVQEVLRHKLANAHPASDGTFAELVDSSVDDFLTYGNVFALNPVEVLEGTDVNGDGQISVQPCPERVGVFDIFPWDLNRDSIAQVNCTIYSPITDDELDDAQYIGPEVAAAVRAGNYKIKSKEDTHLHGERVLDRDIFPDIASFEDTYWGFMYYGNAPWRKIIQYVEDEEARKLLEQAGREGMYMALGTEYGFDPSLAGQAKWWCARIIGEELVYAKPWNSAMPGGAGPIIHVGCIKVPGQLLAMGLYDIGETDEEAHNRMNTASLKLSEMAADPPVWFIRNAIDQEWLQVHGGDFALRPGMKIPVSNMLEKDPIKALTIAFEILPRVVEQSGLFESQLRTLLGVGSDIEGNSTADTATQNVNNVQFGLALLTYMIFRLRRGFMLPVAERSYVGLQQGLREVDQYISGSYEIAPTGYSEGVLKTAAITAQHMIDLAWVSFNITGPNQESSRVATLQQKLSAWQAFIAHPLFNSTFAMEDYYKTMRVPEYRKFNLANAQAAQIEIAASIAASGMTLPPQYQMELGIAPMLPPAQPAPGEDGEEGGGGDIQQNVEGAPESPALPGQETEQLGMRTYVQPTGPMRL